MDKIKRIIFLLFCCGVIVSMVGCGGNTEPLPTESTPTTLSQTVITEVQSETTPPVTAAEPTEKEKESVSTENVAQATSRPRPRLRPQQSQQKKQNLPKQQSRLLQLPKRNPLLLR